MVIRTKFLELFMAKGFADQVLTVQHRLPSVPEEPTDTDIKLNDAKGRSVPRLNKVGHSCAKQQIRFFEETYSIK